MKWTNEQHFPIDAQKFLVKLVNEAVGERKNNNVVRQDLIQAFLDIENVVGDGMCLKM